MPLAVRGIPCRSPQDLFEKCHLNEALKYALELKKTRYSYSEVPDKGKKIGTLDATSCIGVVYRAANDATYVQHLDGRSLESLLEIFDPSPVQVTLIGGCTTADKKYTSLEKHTKENFEKLVEFWNRHRFNIDVQGWAIGDGRQYNTLCSDFIVGKEKIYLVKQGEIGRLNLEMGGKLIPEVPRRLATVSLDQSRYFIYKKTMELPGLKNVNNLKQLAQFIMEHDDETVLKNCSTTPDLEPPYFPQMMRDMASFVLNQKMPAPPLKVALLGEHPVFAIQGEIVSSLDLCSE